MNVIVIEKRENFAVEETFSATVGTNPNSGDYIVPIGE